jgi:hypothetical protein
MLYVVLSYRYLVLIKQLHESYRDLHQQRQRHCSILVLTIFKKGKGIQSVLPTFRSVDGNEAGIYKRDFITGVNMYLKKRPE